MAIEAVKTVGVTYQGSTAQTDEATTDTAQMAASGVDVSPAAGQVNDSIRRIKNTSDADKTDAAEKNENADRKTGSGKEIRKAVDEINKKAVNSEAIFGIHEKTNRVMIKIIDKDSKKVLKEYPPEKTLDMIAKVWEMAGLMVDEKM